MLVMSLESCSVPSFICQEPKIKHAAFEQVFTLHYFECLIMLEKEGRKSPFKMFSVHSLYKPLQKVVF